jgi:hypothetical protein
MARRPEDFALSFSLAPLGRKSRAKKMLDDARKSLKDTFKSGEIEKTILANIKARLTEPKLQRDPNTGKAWPKLDKTTVKRRVTNLNTGKVKLVDTGSMRAALKVQKKGLKKTTDTRTGTSEIGFKKSAVSKSSPGILIEDIASDHHFGQSFPNGRVLPARPFMGISKKEGKEMEKLFKLRFNRDLVEYF